MADRSGRVVTVMSAKNVLVSMLLSLPDKVSTATLAQRMRAPPRMVVLVAWQASEDVGPGPQATGSQNGSRSVILFSKNSI